MSSFSSFPFGYGGPSSPVVIVVCLLWCVSLTSVVSSLKISRGLASSNRTWSASSDDKWAVDLLVRLRSRQLTRDLCLGHSNVWSVRLSSLTPPPPIVCPQGRQQWITFVVPPSLWMLSDYKGTRIWRPSTRTWWRGTRGHFKRLVGKGVLDHVRSSLLCFPFELILVCYQEIIQSFGYRTRCKWPWSACICSNLVVVAFGHVVFASGAGSLAFAFVFVASDARPLAFALVVVASDASRSYLVKNIKDHPTREEDGNSPRRRRSGEENETTRLGRNVRRRKETL